jgi:hypothetical protein
MSRTLLAFVLHARGFMLLALFAALFAAGAGTAHADTDTGEITITVVDVRSSAPVSDARAFLIGPTTASSLTTSAGVIHYTDVPSGIYRVRVFRPGFQAGISKDFEVLDGRAVAVRVELAPFDRSGLKVIGSVTARSSVNITSSDISDSSAIRRISDSLTDALDKLAGVSVTQSSGDPSGTVTVSLRNHDESQTAVTLDGIPLGPSGSAVNLRGLNTDLFSGASASFSPGAGSLGGSMNFRTIQPTQTWQTRLGAATGTYDRSNYQLAETGSIGKLGLAVQHTWRGSNNPLTGQTYLDESGLDYAHGGESISTGDFLKFRYRLDDRTTFSGTAISSNSRVEPLCTQFVTLVPCGEGPGNEQTGHFAFGYGTLQSLVGNVAATLSVYSNASRSDNDFSNRYVEGVLSPSHSVMSMFSRGIAYSAAAAQGRHTWTFSGNTYSATNESTPLAGSQYELPFTNQIASSTEQLQDAFKASDQITYNTRLSVAATSGAGSSLLGGFGTTWRPQKNDALEGSVSFGSSQPGTNLFKSFSDPATARFDCSGQYAIVQGPGDSAGHQSAVSADLAWTHQLSFGSFTVDAFHQHQTGQLINALVNANSEPAGFFPDGYLAAVALNYQGALACGASAALAPGNVWVMQSIGGTSRTYQGFDLSGRFALGHYVVVLPTYSTNSAILTAADARLSGAISTSIVGAQLPGRPVHRGGLTIDALHPKSGTELLANAQWTGSNNFQNLGPYVTASFGLSHDLGAGRLTVFENNAFNTYEGEFTSAAYQQPLPLSNGGQLALAANPLTPRTISVTYSVVIGGARPSASLVPALAARVASAATPPPPVRLQPVPPPAGADPLSLPATRESCPADAQSLARPVLAELRAYVTAYEAKQPLPEIDGFTVTAHVPAAAPGVLAYYLEFRPKALPGPPAAGAPGNGNEGPPPDGPGGGPPGGGGPGGPPGGGPGGPPGGGFGGFGGSNRTERNASASGDANRASGPPAQVRRFFSLLRCAYVTALTQDDAKSKGIEVPANGRPGIYYAPGIGIVVVRPKELPSGGGSLKSGS